MSKKIFFAIIGVLAIVSISTFCKAADGSNPMQDATNAVRNVVGGAENAIEDGAKSATNAVKSGTNSVENTAENMGNGVENTAKDVKNGVENTTGTVRNTTTENSNNSKYSAIRTSTDANGNATFMGMNSTTWIWLILGIAAIAIVALVWYYSTQITSKKNNRRLD